MRAVLTVAALALFTWAPLRANAEPRPVFEGIDGRTRTSAEIDGAVSRAMKGAEVPGLALALINKGEVVYLKAYGLRTTSPKAPLTVKTVMFPASLGKTVTAYLVMKLVDDHLIDLDKPVYQYLPRPLADYPEWRDIADDPRSRLITMRMLLSHTAGFPNWRYFDPDHRLAILHDPGTRYDYGGEGFGLLQLVVETVTRTPYDVLMQARVFRPLGMTRTSMVWRKAFETDHANGYDEYGRLLGVQRRIRADANGSMHTTVADYAKFIQAVLSGRGLSRASHAEILKLQIPIVSKVEFPTGTTETTEAYKPIRLSYGLGVGLYRTPHGPAFFKEGHDEGWRAYFVCHQDQATCMVIFTNGSNGESLYSALLEGLLGDTWNPIDWEGFTPFDKLPPRKPLSDHSAISLPPAVPAMYAGRYGAANHVLTIEAEGDHLSVAEDGAPKRELFPQTYRDFFAKDRDETFTFLFDLMTGAFRVLREAGGKDELLSNVDWTRCKRGVCAAQGPAS
jgi:CubicO group peptidase (beta-lactamase class C family)